MVVCVGYCEADGADRYNTAVCVSANAAGRCVRTVHHIDHFTTPELAACHERAIVEPYAHVCVSEAVAAELRDGWGVKAEVIPNGVHSARFAAAATDVPALNAWRRRLGLYRSLAPSR